MIIERRKNATRNIISGLILKVVQMLLPFIARTAMIYTLGVEYLGLNGIFSSLLQVLNLAELGVGSAMVFSMYKPIINDDTKMICALIHLYRTYYRIIGLVIAILGLILLPFIPHLINGELPKGMNVYALYLINLGATVLSYWLFAYKNSLLSAHQREDIISNIQMVFMFIQYGIQLFILYCIRDYYLYVITTLGIQVVINIATAVIATKMYPEYKPVGNPDKGTIRTINRNIKDLVTGKIGTVVFSSTDTIVISTFLGLQKVALYQNYYFIVSSLIGIIQIVFTACLAGIGNSLVVETKEKNLCDFKRFTFLIAWIAGFCSVCLLCLLQPFMTVWVGESLQLGFNVVICFCVYFFVWELYRTMNVYKDAAGLWRTDRFRPAVVAFANICVNLILVNVFGVFGVILATVLTSSLIGIPWILFNLFGSLFDRTLISEYIRKLLLYTVSTVIASVVTYYICSIISLGEWSTLIIRMGICLIIPNFIFLIMYRKQIEFYQSILLFDRITCGKFKLIRLFGNANVNIGR